MSRVQFYKNLGPFSLNKITQIVGASLSEGENEVLIHNIKSLKEAEFGDLTFLNNKKYNPHSQIGKAGKKKFIWSPKKPLTET